MLRYVVVLVSFDYFRYEKYLGIYSELGLTNLDKLPMLTVELSQVLADERTATQVMGSDCMHYMVEEIVND